LRGVAKFKKGLADSLTNRKRRKAQQEENKQKENEQKEQ